MQVSLACDVPSCPLLHLVSSGCHAAMSTLQSRLQRLIPMLAVHEQHRGSELASTSAASMFSFSILTRPQFRKALSIPCRKNRHSAGSPHVSRLLSRYHSVECSSRPNQHRTLSGPHSISTAVPTALDHQYPVQFMIAVANTARTIQKVLSRIACTALCARHMMVLECPSSS